MKGQASGRRPLYMGKPEAIRRLSDEDRNDPPWYVERALAYYRIVHRLQRMNVERAGIFMGSGVGFHLKKSRKY